jgi:hypothetical protein
MGALAGVQRREGYCRQYRRFQTSESWSELTRMLLPFCLTPRETIDSIEFIEYNREKARREIPAAARPVPMQEPRWK